MLEYSWIISNEGIHMSWTLWVEKGVSQIVKITIVYIFHVTVFQIITLLTWESLSQYFFSLDGLAMIGCYHSYP